MTRSSDIHADFHENRTLFGFSREVAAQTGGPLGATMMQRGLHSLRGAIGTPEHVRQLLRGYEEIGVDQMIFVMQAGANRHEHICESLKLFAREVMPKFHDRHASAPAKALPFDATLTITYFAPAISVSGGGASASSDGPAGAFAVPAGSIAIAAVTTAPPENAPGIEALGISASNAAGSFASGTGSMALSGTLQHQYFGEQITIPLDPVGVGGTAPFATVIFSVPVSGTITGSQWSIGEVALPGAAGTISASGFDLRTPDGIAAMRLIAPFNVALQIGSTLYPSLPGVAQLDIAFTPEPGTAVLFALGLAGFAARRR